MSKHTKGTQFQIADDGDHGQSIVSATQIEEIDHPFLPLPSSEEFRGYENAVPGAGERILTLAERQFEHRIESEKKQLELETKRQDNEHNLRTMGLMLGVLTVWIFILLAIVFSVAGMREAAITAVALPIASFAIYLLKYTVKRN